MTAARRCVVCSRPLAPHTGRGRPRTVCRDEDSPTPGTCRRARNNARDEDKRARRYAAIVTPGADAPYPRLSDFGVTAATWRSGLADAGFSTPAEGRAYTLERRAVLDADYRARQLDAVEQRLAHEERTAARERRAVCREVCPIMRTADVSALVARRLARRREEAAEAELRAVEAARWGRTH